MTQLKAFTMPKWGIEMSEGLIAEWMVREGDAFDRGAVLTLIETDKITNEIEAEAPGRFVRIVAQAGETLPVGALLAVLIDAGEEVAASDVDAFVAAFKPADASFAGNETATTAPEIEPKAQPDFLLISPAAHERAAELKIDVSSVSGTGRGGRIMLQDVDQASRPLSNQRPVGPFPPTPAGSAFASPMARRLAAMHGVDLSGLTGTGPRGRISRSDVLALIPSPAPAPEPAIAERAVLAPAAAVGDDVERVAMSPMRKAIARRLSESKATIPHFYVRRRVRADRLLALRALTPEPRPSMNAYLLRAVALALVEHPALNIQVHGNDIDRYANADISVAVATPKGLMTPVLRTAQSMDVAAIGIAVGMLAERARSGQLRPEEFEGGSFCVSNLGPFGVEQFDAIINPPQGAILAVGAARPEPIDDAGAIRIVPVLHLSLSCDHRAIDGADAGLFLQSIARMLESPERL